MEVIGLLIFQSRGEGLHPRAIDGPGTARRAFHRHLKQRCRALRPLRTGIAKRHGTALPDSVWYFRAL